ncbi:MAG: hypothetical protein ACKO2G_12095, partial [Verrucomicrobiales bacterium]
MPTENEHDEEEPVDWSIEEIGDFQPKEKPPAGTSGKLWRTPKPLVRLVAPFGIVILFVLIGWLINSMLNSRNRQTNLPVEVPSTSDSGDWTKAPPPLAEKFANASTADEWISMVRDPERVAPLVRAFKPRFASGRPLLVEAFGVEPFGSDEVYQFMVTYEDGRSRLIHILPTPKGPKVDWESFARSGGASYAELTAPAVVEAELRVLVQRGRYYNYDFAD